MQLRETFRLQCFLHGRVLQLGQQEIHVHGLPGYAVSVECHAADQQRAQSGTLHNPGHQYDRRLLH